jgi:hypothetical protein
MSDRNWFFVVAAVLVFLFWNSMGMRKGRVTRGNPGLMFGGDPNRATTGDVKPSTNAVPTGGLGPAPVAATTQTGTGKSAMGTVVSSGALTMEF